MRTNGAHQLTRGSGQARQRQALLVPELARMFILNIFRHLGALVASSGSRIPSLRVDAEMGFGVHYENGTDRRRV